MSKDCSICIHSKALQHKNPIIRKASINYQYELIPVEMYCELGHTENLNCKDFKKDPTYEG